MKFLQALVATFQTIGELMRSIWHMKRWWMTPLVLVLMVFGLLLLLASAPGVAPFIYTLF